MVTGTCNFIVTVPGHTPFFNINHVLLILILLETTFEKSLRVMESWKQRFGVNLNSAVFVFQKCRGLPRQGYPLLVLVQGGSPS